MASIKLPTRTVPGITFKACYISPDVTSVNRYCTENGISSGRTFTTTSVPYANDGGYYYQYYSGSTWIQRFGYVSVVNTIDY